MKEKQSCHPASYTNLTPQEVEGQTQGWARGFDQGSEARLPGCLYSSSSSLRVFQSLQVESKGISSVLPVSSCHLVLRLRRVGLWAVHGQDKVSISSTRPMQPHFSFCQHTAAGLPTQKRPLRLTVPPMAETHKRRRSRLRILECAIKWKALQCS